MHTETSPIGGHVGPIVGDLSLTVEDGTTLTASADVALAEQWASYALAEQWETLSDGEQVRHVSEELAVLRRAYYQSEGARI
jgi:hypothetical protein